MDKCIKVELPTGHVLLENLTPIDDRSEDKCYQFSGGDKFQFKLNGYDGWVSFWHNGICIPFKVIAQYGDEFPV